MNRTPAVQGTSNLVVNPLCIHADLVVDPTSFYAVTKPIFLQPCTIGALRILSLTSSGAELRLYDDFSSDRFLRLVTSRTTTGVVSIYATIATNKARPVFLAGPHVLFFNSGSVGDNISIELELIPGIRFRRFE